MNNSTTHHTSTSDFPIVISLLSLMAITLLVLSYYIFVIKSCYFNIHTLGPLRRFSFPRNTRDFNLSTIIPTTTNDTFLYQNRGLDEWHINNIPTFQYKQTKCMRRSSLSYGEECFISGCAVCLNEFHDQEMLRILPRCSHIFHLDCIDIWLVNNASCPLCRSNISGRTNYPIDHIIAPSSSPISSYDPDFVVLELEPNNAQIAGVCDRMKNGRKEKRFSTMGDEGIRVNRVKDEQFCVEKPIRRSFSMDSVVDRGVYLQVREMIMRQNRVVNDNHCCNGVGNHVNGGVNDNYHSFNEEGDQSNNQRFRRGTFFSFGHSRGSSRSSSILPSEIDG